MQKKISFSLWGDSKMYIMGAIDNVRAAKIFYPDWRCHFFVAEDCLGLNILKQMDCDITIMPPQKGIDRTKTDWTWQTEHCSMFWRFFLIDDMNDGDVVIFRDCDSLVSEREAIVVNHWLKTDYIACRIAENKTHWNSFCMSGMFGIKCGHISGIRESIYEWIKFYKTLNHPFIFVDLEFNSSVLAPIIQDRTIGYGFGHPNPLPDLKEGESPIGAVENEQWRNQIFNPEEYVKHATV